MGVVCGCGVVGVVGVGVCRGWVVVCGGWEGVAVEGVGGCVKLE